MSFETIITCYVATALVFFALDYLWLGIIARKFYSQALGSLMLDQIKIGFAAGFYAIYVIGIVIFAVSPALQSGNALDALMWGALFGFFAYATYDMTNLATLRNWPIVMSIVDIIWGTFLTGVAAFAGYQLTSWMIVG